MNVFKRSRQNYSGNLVQRMLNAGHDVKIASKTAKIRARMDYALQMKVVVWRPQSRERGPQCLPVIAPDGSASC
jgi:hypothetical protein